MAQEQEINGSYPPFQREAITLNKTSFIINARYYYTCFEQNDSLGFVLSDYQNNIELCHKNGINALKYNSKNHTLSQSLQIAVDTGNSEFKNRIYIAWADQKNGENNWDVFLIYSDDKGLHWTDPILVSYFPNHKNQTAPKLYINPNNGELLLLYFDGQYAINSNQYDITLAQSFNGGLKFFYYKLNSKPLLSKNKKLFVCFEKQNTELSAIWSNNAEKNQHKFYLNQKSLYSIETPQSTDVLRTASWISFKDTLALQITCAEPIHVDFEVSKPLAPMYQSRRLYSVNFKKGNNTLFIDMKAKGIDKGNYVLTLYYKGYNKFIWITDN